MAVLDMLRKATADGNVDVLREGVRVLAEAIMEAEVSELTGAGVPCLRWSRITGIMAAVANRRQQWEDEATHRSSAAVCSICSLQGDGSSI
jgi:hypothetical protein